MNVCCNKLYRTIHRNRQRLNANVLSANVVGLNAPEINYRKAQTIKASDDWIKRKLKFEGNHGLIKLAERFEFRQQDFQLNKAERHHFAVLEEA